MRILFVSSEHPETRWLYKALRESAHSLCRCDDLTEGVWQAQQEAFDATILMLHDRSQHADLQSKLPQFWSAVRGSIVIVMLADATPQVRSEMLRAGADACFSRPFSFIEVHERLQALRRIALTDATSQPVGEDSVQLDPITRELVSGEQRVPLTKTEYLLVECLIRRLNSPVKHEQVVRYAWPDREYIDQSSVTPLIWRLRCKLKARLPRVRINTVNCYGYQLSLEPSLECSAASLNA